VTPVFIEKLKQVLETNGVPQADVLYVVASCWTQDQVPEIQNEAQYRQYFRRWHALNAATNASAPPNFTRSREGMYLDCLGARLIDWEEKTAAAHADKERHKDG
jgi:hypothetical protein